MQIKIPDFNINNYEWPRIGDFNGLSQDQAIRIFDGLPLGYKTHFKKAIKYINIIDHHIEERLTAFDHKDDSYNLVHSKLPIHKSSIDIVVRTKELLQTAFHKGPLKRRKGKALRANSNKTVHTCAINHIHDVIYDNLSEYPFTYDYVCTQSNKHVDGYKTISGLGCINTGKDYNFLYIFNDGINQNYLKHPGSKHRTILSMKIDFLLNACLGMNSYTNMTFDDLRGLYFIDESVVDEFTG